MLVDLYFVCLSSKIEINMTTHAYNQFYAYKCVRRVEECKHEEKTK